METDADRDRTTTVAVRPGEALAARSRLVASLEAAFPVSFKPASGGRIAADAVISVGDRDGLAGDRELPVSPLPTLAIGDRPLPQSDATDVLLSDSDSMDPRLRGISVRDSVQVPGLEAAGGSQEVLATIGTEPAWTKSRGPAPVHRLRSSLPELSEEQSLRDLFERRALTLVALIHFLRELTAIDAFRPPGLRATILFDDPNLRWRTYGFIDYRALLAHADAHGYHAAMAMIPLDGWLQHRPTVELFRRRADRLSLVLHGNNHLARELMASTDYADAVATAAQAMRRAERLEARYGLRMDRVMTPPHGMCSAAVARALGALGFDALCAIHPFPWTERAPADRPLAGWDPAEFACGCAVIPRIPLTTAFSELAFRAFLDQPLVLYGHHDDLSGGLDLLSETVSRVNRLGEIRWTSLGEIAATNYASRQEGSTMRIRPYSHRLRIDVPEGVDSVVIAEPRGSGDELSARPAEDSQSVPLGSSFNCGEGALEVRLRPASHIDPSSVPSPAPRIWPILRRAATEVRDRLRPLLPAGSA
jgi:hypothetical protein